VLNFLACMRKDFVLSVLVEELFSQRGHASAKGVDRLIAVLWN
jgi:hypothetical protein